MIMVAPELSRRLRLPLHHPHAITWICLWHNVFRWNHSPPVT